MEDQGRGLTVGEVAEMLDGVHPETVRRYLRDGLLRARPRLPGGHRRIDAASVKELIAVMEMPDGEDKVQTLEGLKRRNRGEPEPEI